MFVPYAYNLIYVDADVGVVPVLKKAQQKNYIRFYNNRLCSYQIVR